MRQRTEVQEVLSHRSTTLSEVPLIAAAPERRPSGVDEPPTSTVSPMSRAVDRVEFPTRIDPPRRIRVSGRGRRPLKLVSVTGRLKPRTRPRYLHGESMRSSRGPEPRPRYRCVALARQSTRNAGSRGTRTLIPALPFCQLTLRATKPRPSAYPDTLSSIGDQIRARRFDLGLLQREAAVAMGVDKSSVWRWERNLTSPDLHAMPGIVRFLNYEPAEPTCTRPVSALLRLRRLRGMSQKDLARALGVDPGTVGKWERGEGMPEGKLLARVETTEAWRAWFGDAIELIWHRGRRRADG